MLVMRAGRVLSAGSCVKERLWEAAMTSCTLQVDVPSTSCLALTNHFIVFNLHQSCAYFLLVVGMQCAAL